LKSSIGFYYSNLKNYNFHSEFKIDNKNYFNPNIEYLFNENIYFNLMNSTCINTLDIDSFCLVAGYIKKNWEIAYENINKKNF
jgi:hypothetical protein